FFTSIDDVREDTLLVREASKPFPEQMEGESRPFCYLAGQGKVFYMSSKPDDAAVVADPKKTPMKQVTYLYDTKENTFTELKPKHTPPLGGVQDVEYVESQKCAFAVIGNQQWVYSFEKNDWAQMPLTVDAGGRMSFQSPYSQLVWVEKYGVFVNLSAGTWLLRPDFARIPGNAISPVGGN
ncbi:MAG: hypothetical protein PHU85_11805, partial [Phycisphaerae bacterium]|nr:hypothetical protein [Phycisphaerae bacterium]